MKKLLLLTCVVFMSLMASAQVTWNVKAGVGYGGEALCAKFGVGSEIHLSDKWSIMPTLEGARKYVDATPYGDNCWYVQIPINAAYRINLSGIMNMKIKAGPYFAYMVHDKTWTDCYYDHDDYRDWDRRHDSKKFDAGLNAGIDFEVRHFVIGVEAEYGFITPNENQEYDYDYDISNTFAFYATIGWRF